MTFDTQYLTCFFVFINLVQYGQSSENTNFTKDYIMSNIFTRLDKVAKMSGYNRALPYLWSIDSMIHELSFQEKMRKINEFPMGESKMFHYSPLWTLTFIIIASIFAAILLGCVVAICYKRRPYRRATKIYEIESAIRNKNVPKIPSIHVTTKSAEIFGTRGQAYKHYP